MAGEVATVAVLLPFSAAVRCVGERGRESESERRSEWAPVSPSFRLDSIG